MRKVPIAIKARMLFFSCALLCIAHHPLLHAQTSSDQTVTNRFYSPSGKWVKVSDKDCEVWSSFSRENETVTWSGAVTNGKAHGVGTLQWFTNGSPTSLYEGELKNGMYDGPGVSKASKNGASWEGDWEKGQLVSKTMTCKYENGGWYKGEQKGGFKDGQGEEVMVGGKYIGYFRQDFFEGKGDMIFPDGGRISLGRQPARTTGE